MAASDIYNELSKAELAGLVVLILGLDPGCSTDEFIKAVDNFEARIREEYTQSPTRRTIRRLERGE